MGILDRIFRREPTEARGAVSGSPLGSGFAPGPTAAGHLVNARIVENLSTVLACVGAVGSVTASLPAYVYRREGRGRVEVPDHPVSRLLRRPNAAQTWPDWIEWTLAQVLLQGNALSIIDCDGAGRPTALRPVPWGNVQPILLANGTLAFDVVAHQAPWGGTGRPVRYLAGEVFHLRDRSDDGLLGRSRLSRAPEVLGNALGLQEWAGSIWRNAATPSGVLKFPGPIPKEVMDRLREQFSGGFTGSHNARREPLYVKCCLVTSAQIDTLMDTCQHDGVGGLLAHKLADTLKTSIDGPGGVRVASTVDRSDKWLAQTPQMFRMGPLKAAIERVGSGATDEASAMEAMGLHPRLVPGGAQNFKVTYPDDFALAAAVLAQRAHGATLDRFGGARGQVAPAVGKKTMF